MSILLQKAEASFGKILKNSKLFSKRTSSLNTKSNQVQQTEKKPEKNKKKKKKPPNNILLWCRSCDLYSEIKLHINQR